MNLPKGNALFERQFLTSGDIKILMDNLSEQKFSGYIQLEVGDASRKWRGVMFYSMGLVKTAIDVTHVENYKLLRTSVLINKIKQAGASVSVYILSPKLVDVLSNIHLLSKIYDKSPLKKKELRKMLDEAEENMTYAVVELSARGNTNLLVMEQGHFVFDSFADYYGGILVNQDKIDEFVDFLVRNGGTISMSAAAQADMKAKELEANRIIENERELMVKKAGGMFGANDVKIDESVFRSWPIPKQSKFVMVDISSPTGFIFSNIKCVPAKNIGQAISLPDSHMKQMGVRENDTLLVRPVLQQ